jgi:hypothetical protein
VFFIQGVGKGAGHASLGRVLFAAVVVFALLGISSVASAQQLIVDDDSHLDDAIPERPSQALELASAREKVVCFGDGVSGPRIEVFHLVADDDIRPTPVTEIRRAIGAVASIVEESSHRHGGPVVTPRFVHDANCYPKITRLVVPDDVLPDYKDTFEWIRRKGYVNKDRKYLLFADTFSPTCGMGSRWLDNSPDQGNWNNTYYGHAYISRKCWNYAETHELFHMLGAVDAAAPNSTGHGHCTDEFDIMCYEDSAHSEMRQVCGGEWDQLLDCNGDDYFNPSPAPGSYLATHWNTYNSRFLARGSGQTFQDPDDDPADPEITDSSSGGSRTGTDTGEASRGTDKTTEQVSFYDTVGNVFASDIATLAESGITKGCNPPKNDRFCPEAPVTRGQMAAFLVRALGLAGAEATFSDTRGHVFEADVAALAGAGITRGCGAGRFCPDEPVTRGQMAAFLVRAGLTD